MNLGYHGVCVTDLSPKNGFDEKAKMLNLAIDSCPDINGISAVRFGPGGVFI